MTATGQRLPLGWTAGKGRREPDRIHAMANLTLVYGMRLLPSEEVAEVGEATIKLKNGRNAHVTMHVLEGSKEQIEKQLKTSLEAFFDFYPEI
jgi:divalent metal cation (Fe/Co/Zn/Cd) transporter